MAFKIKQSNTPKHKNVFFVKSSWMSGDADSYDEVTKEFDYKKQKAAEEFVDVLNSLCKVSGEDLCDDVLWDHIQNYQHLIKDVEEFHDTVRVDKINEEEREDQIKDVLMEYFDIPSDSTCDHQFSASFVSVNVVFFDENGFEREVKIT